ncbi:MAG: tetratricopeptide repeat protein [Catenulispora sp.]|nr:tetratricopeptide repeat protein [Catenulispora sp.]
MTSNEALPTEPAAFIVELRRQKFACGDPSLRVLERRTGIARSTLADALDPMRPTLPRIEVVRALIRAFGLPAREAAAWEEEWKQARARLDGAAEPNGDGPAAPDGVPHQLPADPATFVGRKQELAHLLAEVGRRTAAGTVPVCVIEGMAGIGKTHLALHAAHELVRAGHYQDMQFFVNLRGFDRDRPPADPADVLGTLLRQQGVPDALIPAAADERAAMFRDRIHDRSALLLLDNAADEAQIKDLIPASPRCLVLVTSRRALTGLADAMWHRIGVYPQQEALSLLTRIAGEPRAAAEPEAARRIVRRCGLLPLAVSVAATRLRSRPAWRLADLAERLEREDATASDLGGAAFDVSYRELPDRAKHLFRLLGVHPGLDFTAASVAAAAGLRPAEAERALELLLDENLLQQKVAGRYEIHDLLRVYAAERAEQELTDDERRAAVRTTLLWHVAVVTRTALTISPDRVLPPIDAAVADVSAPQAHTSAEAVLWYGRERANLMQAIEVAGRLGLDSLAWRLPISMAYFEELAQNYQELVRLMSTALPHARRDPDPDGETDVARWLSFALDALGRSAEAIEPLNQVLSDRQAAGDTLRAGRIMGSLASVHERLDDPERGLELALRAFQTIEEAGGPVPSAILTITSICLIKLGRLSEALEYQQRMVERSREAGDPRAFALGQHNVGDTCILQGRMAEAAEAFEEAIAVAAEVGDRFVQADCLNGLAVTLRARGRIEEARARHREAIAVFDDLPEPEAARYLAQLEASSLRYVE